MSFPLKGYAGKVLWVDLTKHEVKEVPLPKRYALEYIGGTGLGGRILWDHVGPQTGPLSPDNLLLVVTGPVTGTIWHTSGRGAMVSKSPLTGIWAESHFGGHFAPELKYAGYDMIIIKGRSEKPVYLKVEDGKAEIRSAEGIWGRGVYETTELVREEFSDEDAKVLAIGKAGENLVRYAAVMSAPYDAAGRTGMGAVMGSKRLKAIAIRGFGSVKVADPKGLMEFAKEAKRRILESEHAMQQRKYGTPMLVEVKQQIGELPTKNHWNGVFEKYEEIGSVKLREEHWRATKACTACFIACKKFFEASSGRFAGTLAGHVEYETLYAFGSNLMNADVDSILYIDRLCDDYGLDTISAGASIAFLMECYEKGLVSKEQVDGLDLSWGNVDAIIELIHKIVKREGIGDLLAEGVRRAAEKIGKGAEKYAIHVKGLEVSGQDGRAHRSAGLTHATAARGADHLRSLVTVDQLGYEDVAAERFGKDKLPGICDGQSEEHKALAVKIIEDVYAVRDALIVCWYSVSWPPVFWIEDFATVLKLVTGYEGFADPRKLMIMGERMVNLKRAFNVREGIRRKDDTLPERFTKEPMPAGPAKGQVVDLERMLNEYYQLRNWDFETGIPKRETFERLDMMDIAEELERSGVKLP